MSQHYWAAAKETRIRFPLPPSNGYEAVMAATIALSHPVEQPEVGVDVAPYDPQRR